MPGKEWPEKYLVSLAENEVVMKLVELWQVDKNRLTEIMDEAIAAGKHNEFYVLQEKLGQSIDVIRNDVVREVSTKAREEFIIIENAIGELLNEI